MSDEERWSPAGWPLQQNYASWKLLHDAGPEYPAQNESWSHDVYLREGVPTICCTQTGGKGSWAPDEPVGYKPLCSGGLLYCNWRWEGDPWPTSQDACEFGRQLHNCAPCGCGERSYYLIEGLFLCQQCRVIWMREKLQRLREDL